MNGREKTIFGVVAILVCVTALIAGPLWLTPKEIVPWRTDLTTALAESNQTHKPILIDFNADWCGPCQRMRHTTWASKSVAVALQSYVPVSINVDQQPDVAQRYHISPIPMMAVLNPDGSVARETVGALEPDEFLDWLSGKSE